jgi:glucose-1-phosphate thymidylyltransferase
MIYYPLSTLMLAGIREILIITRPSDQAHFEQLLGDGSQLGLRLRYLAQPRPDGIAQALVLGSDFIGDGTVALILGDNVFYGVGLGLQLRAHSTLRGARIFAYRVANPHEYAVVEFDGNFKVSSIEEKPLRPRTRYAVPGLYFYDNRAVRIAEELGPSHRGELEITAVNEAYLRLGELHVTVLPRGTAWLDTGTFASLVHASEFVRVTEERQGLKIGCIEEVAWRLGLIDDEQLLVLAEPQISSGYGGYLLRLVEEARDPAGDGVRVDRHRMVTGPRS